MCYIANKPFNAEVYRIVNGSSMYAYLSHYLYIILVAVLLIRPYQIPFVPALVIEVILVNMVIILTYLLFDWIYRLIFDACKEKPEDDQEEEERAKTASQ